MATSEERRIIQQKLRAPELRHTSKPVSEFVRRPVELPSTAVTHPLPSPLPLGQQKPADGTLYSIFPSTHRATVLDPGPSKVPRQPRRCRRCGMTTKEGCNGSMSIANCFNPCQDCGRHDCAGRDPKNFRNSKTCNNTGNRIVKG